MVDGLRVDGGALGGLVLRLEMPMSLRHAVAAVLIMLLQSAFQDLFLLSSDVVWQPKLLRLIKLDLPEYFVLFLCLLVVHHDALLIVVWKLLLYLVLKLLDEGLNSLVEFKLFFVVEGCIVQVDPGGSAEFGFSF